MQARSHNKITSGFACRTAISLNLTPPFPVGFVSCVWMSWAVLSCALYLWTGLPYMPSQDASVVASLNESLSTPDKKNVSVLKKTCPTPFSRWYYGKHIEACVLRLCFFSLLYFCDLDCSFWPWAFVCVTSAKLRSRVSSLYIRSTSRRYDKSRFFKLRAFLPPLYHFFFLIASVQIFADENLLTLWWWNIVRVHVN